MQPPPRDRIAQRAAGLAQEDVIERCLGHRDPGQRNLRGAQQLDHRRQRRGAVADVEAKRPVLGAHLLDIRLARDAEQLRRIARHLRA
jgi:hypothetical protein